MTITDMMTPFFWGKQVNEQAILVTIKHYNVPAEAWNGLRDIICNDTTINDSMTVYFDYLYINGEDDRFSYVTVENWRRRGFSAGNIKTYIGIPDEKIVTEANEYYYNNIRLLETCVLPLKRQKRIITMVTKAHHIKEFKAFLYHTRGMLAATGMTDDEINTLFLNCLQDVYHPKA